MKKALFLTAGYGTGHLTANKSVMESYGRLYPGELEVTTLDFLNMSGYLSTGGMFKELYNRSMETQS